MTQDNQLDCSLVELLSTGGGVMSGEGKLLLTVRHEGSLKPSILAFSKAQAHRLFADLGRLVNESKALSGPVDPESSPLDWPNDFERTTRYNSPLDPKKGRGKKGE